LIWSGNKLDFADYVNQLIDSASVFGFDTTLGNLRWKGYSH
jgi:hypothetical protein